MDIEKIQDLPDNLLTIEHIEKMENEIDNLKSDNEYLKSKFGDEVADEVLANDKKILAFEDKLERNKAFMDAQRKIMQKMEDNRLDDTPISVSDLPDPSLFDLGGMVEEMQEMLEQRVRDLTSDEYANFAINYKIDPDDAMEMSDFIYSLNPTEIKEVTKVLDAKRYEMGGEIQADRWVKLLGPEKYRKYVDDAFSKMKFQKLSNDKNIYRINTITDKSRTGEFGDLIDFYFTERLEKEGIGYAKGGKIDVDAIERSVMILDDNGEKELAKQLLKNKDKSTFEKAVKIFEKNPNWTDDGQMVYAEDIVNEYKYAKGGDIITPDEHRNLKSIDDIKKVVGEKVWSRFTYNDSEDQNERWNKFFKDHNGTVVIEIYDDEVEISANSNQDYSDDISFLETYLKEDFESEHFAKGGKISVDDVLKFDKLVGRGENVVVSDKFDRDYIFQRGFDDGSVDITDTSARTDNPETTYRNMPLSEIKSIRIDESVYAKGGEVDVDEIIESVKEENDVWEAINYELAYRGINDVDLVDEIEEKFYEKYEFKRGGKAPKNPMEDLEIYEDPEGRGYSVIIGNDVFEMNDATLINYSTDIHLGPRANYPSDVSHWGKRISYDQLPIAVKDKITGRMGDNVEKKNFGGFIFGTALGGYVGYKYGLTKEKTQVRDLFKTEQKYAKKAQDRWGKKKSGPKNEDIIDVDFEEYKYAKGGKIKAAFYRWGEFQEEEEIDSKDIHGMVVLGEETEGFDVRDKDEDKVFLADSIDIDDTDYETEGYGVKRSYAIDKKDLPKEKNLYAKGGKTKKGKDLYTLVWEGDDEYKIPKTYTEKEVEKEIKYFNDRNLEYIINEDFEESDDGKHWVLQKYREVDYAKGGKISEKDKFWDENAEDLIKIVGDNPEYFRDYLLSIGLTQDDVDAEMDGTSKHIAITILNMSDIETLNEFIKGEEGFAKGGELKDLEKSLKQFINKLSKEKSLEVEYGGYKKFDGENVILVHHSIPDEEEVEKELEKWFKKSNLKGSYEIYSSVDNQSPYEGGWWTLVIEQPTTYAKGGEIKDSQKSFKKLITKLSDDLKVKYIEYTDTHGFHVLYHESDEDKLKEELNKWAKSNLRKPYTIYETFVGLPAKQNDEGWWIMILNQDAKKDNADKPMTEKQLDKIEDLIVKYFDYEKVGALAEDMEIDDIHDMDKREIAEHITSFWKRNNVSEKDAREGLQIYGIIGYAKGGKAKVGDITLNEIEKSWKKYYGEDFKEEYYGLYDKLKTEKNLTAQKLDKLWAQLYGEKFKYEYYSVYEDLGGIYTKEEKEILEENYKYAKGGKIKVGDTLYHTDSPVGKKKGTVVKVMPDMVNVDFGQGDVYGITKGRIKGDKIYAKGGDVDEKVSEYIDDFESVKPYHDIAKKGKKVKDLSGIDDPDEDGIIGEHFDFTLDEDGRDVFVRVYYDPPMEEITVFIDTGNTGQEDYYSLEDFEELVNTGKFAKGGELDKMNEDLGRIQDFIRGLGGADDWDWDGEELTLFNGDKTEKYSAKTLINEGVLKHANLHFKKGGTIDYFQHYDKLPKKMRNILDKYFKKYEEGKADYKDTKKLLEDVEKEGYTFEYGLDNEPYDLKKFSKMHPLEKHVGKKNK